VWWINTGEIPGSGQIVHHINEDKTDNRFENLEVLDRSEHAKHHGDQKKKMMVILRCPACSEIFERARNKTHLVKGGMASYCSRSCAASGGKKGRVVYEDNVVEVYLK